MVALPLSPRQKICSRARARGFTPFGNRHQPEVLLGLKGGGKTGKKCHKYLCSSFSLGLAFPVGQNVGMGFTPILRHLSLPSMHNIFMSHVSCLFHVFHGKGTTVWGVRRRGVKPLPIRIKLRALPFPRGCRGLPCRGLGCPQITLLFIFSLAACGGKRENEEVFKGCSPLNPLT